MNDANFAFFVIYVREKAVIEVRLSNLHCLRL